MRTPGFHTGFFAGGGGGGGRFFVDWPRPLAKPHPGFHTGYGFISWGGGELCIIIAFLLERGE